MAADAALGGDGATVVATGGLAPLLAQYIPAIRHVAPTLTLDGLRIIHDLNPR